MSFGFGKFLCFIAVVAFLAPLPAVHLCADGPHIEFEVYQDEEAGDCDCPDPADHHKAPDKVRQDRHVDKLHWVSSAPTIDMALPAPTWRRATTEEASAAGFAPLVREDIRGPPRLLLSLYCTLLV